MLALQKTKLAKLTLAAIRGVELAEYRGMLLSSVGPNSVRLELVIVGHLFTVARTEWGMEGLRNPLSASRKPKPPRGRDRRLLLRKRTPNPP